MYEKRQPTAKRTMAGIVIERITLTSFSSNAGLRNPTASLTTSGMPKTTPSNKEM